MVSSFMRSSVWIHVVQFLQRDMQMAPNYVGRRKRLPRSSAEQESQLSAGNELFEQSSNRRVKIDLTGGIRSFEPFLDLSATNFLLDVEDPDTKHVTNGGGGPHLEYAAPVSFLVFLLKASETGLSK
jgi:hypothetical protein